MQYNICTFKLKEFNSVKINFNFLHNFTLIANYTKTNPRASAHSVIKTIGIIIIL